MDARKLKRPQVQSQRLSPEEAVFYEALVVRLVEVRQARGLTQSELDHALGTSEGHVAKWESLARLPSAFWLMCWCQALGVRLEITIPCEVPA